MHRGCRPGPAVEGLRLGLLPALWAATPSGDLILLGSEPRGGGDGSSGAGSPSPEPRELESQLEEIRRESGAESVCLMAFGPARAQVLGTAGVSVPDLDALRMWRPQSPLPEPWQCLRQEQRDLTLVLCIKSGRLERIEKMARAYLVQWLATVVFARRKP